MESDRIAELLYDALKHEYVVYVDDVLKAVGFLLIALGWLLTSETASKALQAPNMNTIAACCILAVAANIAFLLIGHYIRARRLAESLTRVAPEARDLVVNYSIRLEHILVNTVVLSALVILLFVVVWHLRE
jgi:hypothetical protein